MSDNTSERFYENLSVSTTPITQETTFSFGDLKAALEVLQEVEEDGNPIFISGATGKEIPPVQQDTGYITPPEQQVKDSSEENTPPGVLEERHNRTKEWAKETKEFGDRFGIFENPERIER